MIENTAALWVWTVQVKVGAGWYPAASSDQPGSCRDIPMGWRCLRNCMKFCDCLSMFVQYLSSTYVIRFCPVSVSRCLEILTVTWLSWILDALLWCLRPAALRQHSFLKQSSGGCLRRHRLKGLLQESSEKLRMRHSRRVDWRIFKNSQELWTIVKRVHTQTYLDILRHLWCQSCSFSKILLAFGTRVILQDWFNNHQEGARRCAWNRIGSKPNK